MADMGWTARVAAAAGASAGTGAAQLGLGYGLGVVVWPLTDTPDDSVWLGSLGWATWITASATVLGAVIASRLGGGPGPRSAGPVRLSGPWRLALAAAAAVGALVSVALIALPARSAVRGDTFSPQVIAAGYAFLGVLLGLIVAYWAVVSRPVATNLITTGAWLWALAISAVLVDLTLHRSSATYLTSWQFTGRTSHLYGTIYWPSAVLTLVAAFAIGVISVVPAARRGHFGLGAATSGAVGPLLVAAAFFVLAPQLTGTRGPLESAYLIAPYAVIAGLAGSALTVSFIQGVQARRATAARPGSGDDDQPADHGGRILKKDGKKDRPPNRRDRSSEVHRHGEPSRSQDQLGEPSPGQDQFGEPSPGRDPLGGRSPVQDQLGERSPERNRRGWRNRRPTATPTGRPASDPVSAEPRPADEISGSDRLRPADEISGLGRPRPGDSGGSPVERSSGRRAEPSTGENATSDDSGTATVSAPVEPKRSRLFSRRERRTDPGSPVAADSGPAAAAVATVPAADPATFPPPAKEKTTLARLFSRSKTPATTADAPATAPGAEESAGSKSARASRQPASPAVPSKPVPGSSSSAPASSSPPSDSSTSNPERPLPRPVDTPPPSSPPTATAAPSPKPVTSPSTPAAPSPKPVTSPSTPAAPSPKPAGGAADGKPSASYEPRQVPGDRGDRGGNPPMPAKATPPKGQTGGSTTGARAPASGAPASGNQGSGNQGGGNQGGGSQGGGSQAGSDQAGDVGGGDPEIAAAARPRGTRAKKASPKVPETRKESPSTVTPPPSSPTVARINPRPPSG